MPHRRIDGKNKGGTKWRMTTVDDLMRHHTALEVICENCPRRTVLNNRFLKRNYGARAVITELRFVCSVCRSPRFRLNLVPDDLGEKEPLRMQSFRGVYEKYTDEREGSHSMTFTLDKLARSLRGTPRDARMLIQLPDGSLAEIDHVRPGFVGAREDGNLETQSSAHGAHYGIVLVPKIT